MKSLNLADNHIGDADIASFVENWPEDSRLELLDLQGNQINTTVGVQGLMTALPNRRAMKTLNLTGNGFGFREVEMIGNCLPNLKIREIHMGEVMFDVDEMRRIRVMDRWLQGIKANHFLQTIYMHGNRNISGWNSWMGSISTPS
jgi:Ran GTPase-activating protein (RanGAP) involved in mRNA processing and transport